MMELAYENPNVEYYKLNVTDVAGIEALKAYVVEKLKERNMRVRERKKYKRVERKK